MHKGIQANRTRWAIVAALILPCAMSGVTYAADAADCSTFNIDAANSKPLAAVETPHAGACKAQTVNGLPIPDPRCTPGAVNSTLTISVLRDPGFRTGCVRDNATSASQKASTYVWYAIPHPAHNQGVTQVCELDHLISLELGGADSLENIWPQCGPSHVVLRERFFKQKDAVENYLAKQVREGVMRLEDAQSGIARDWTQYLQAAQACTAGNCR